MAKYKTPSYIRPCDKCGQGKGFHSESPTYRLCDTCFRAKSDSQLEALLISEWAKDQTANAWKIASSNC